MSFASDLADAVASGRPFIVSVDAQTGQRAVEYYPNEAEFLAEAQASRVSQLRARRRRQVIDEGVRRIGLVLPGFDTLEEITRLATLTSENVLNDSLGGDGWVEGKRLYVKARSLANQVLTMPAQQLLDIDPTDDALWAP